MNALETNSDTVEDVLNARDDGTLGSWDLDELEDYRDAVKALLKDVELQLRQDKELPEGESRGKDWRYRTIGFQRFCEIALHYLKQQIKLRNRVQKMQETMQGVAQ